MPKQDEDTKDEDVPPVEPLGEPSLKEIKNALYARCASLPTERVFTQGDLLSFQIIPHDDLQKLLSSTKQLTKEGLFKLMTKDGRACWKVVKREDAAKFVQIRV